MTYYCYGMRLKSSSPGCQPKDGFIRCIDDFSGKYHDILVYDRKLDWSELLQYDLDFIKEKRNIDCGI